MKSIGLAVAFLLLLPVVGQAKEPVWFWFATCDGPLMTLEVRFDNRIVHKVTVPLCRADRVAPASQGEEARIQFTWRANRPIVWTGYQERADRTPANTALEMDIWQAGADADALTLGVSVGTANRLLMNTVHLAHPSSQDESEIAKGLSVRTYPTTK